jgi:hypothetical protein
MSFSVRDDSKSALSKKILSRKTSPRNQGREQPQTAAAAI